MDLYETGKKMEVQVRRITNSPDISQANKELILKFKDRCFAEGLSDKRVLIYMVRLDHLAKWLNKDFAALWYFFHWLEQRFEERIIAETKKPKPSLPATKKS